MAETHEKLLGRILRNLCVRWQNGSHFNKPTTVIKKLRLGFGIVWKEDGRRRGGRFE
jgi:hypothetical protein